VNSPENDVSQLNDELAKRGLLSGVAFVAHKNEEFAALTKGCEGFAELHELLSCAEDILVRNLFTVLSVASIRFG
jgi:hypothetical protein